MNKTGKFSKFIVAVAGMLTTALTTYYGSARWEPLAIAGVTAAVVYLVPNQGGSV